MMFVGISAATIRGAICQQSGRSHTGGSWELFGEPGRAGTYLLAGVFFCCHSVLEELTSHESWITRGGLLVASATEWQFNSSYLCEKKSKKFPNEFLKVVSRSTLKRYINTIKDASREAALNVFRVRLSSHESFGQDLTLWRGPTLIFVVMVVLGGILFRWYSV